ncbi:MAG: D-erythronate 2-dehydrogenase, partial [bacterium]
EQIEALRRAAGEEAVRLIRREPDPMIMEMVGNWAAALDATRAERLGFTAEQAVGVGDAENDREMLEWAGFGVAVENADERLKRQADMVIPSVHEDGVAQLLEALVDARRPSAD